MNILQIKANEVYVDSDDVSIIIQRPDINGRKPSNVDPSVLSMYNKANVIIEKASAEGKYFDIAGRDDVVRSLIVLKSGIVIGTNNNPDTIAKKIKSEIKAKQSEKKNIRQVKK